MEIIRNGDITNITYTDSGQIAEIKKHGNKFHEFTMLEAIAEMDIKPGTFVDVGAHVGNHSIFFAKYCKSCVEVMSFELSPITFEVLKENTKDYNIIPFNYAIGSHTGTCNVSHNKERPGQSKITEGNSIPMRALDGIVFNMPPSLIKIDVEGHEIEVLKGSEFIIETFKPELFIEHGGNPLELLEYLPKGYKIKKRYNNAPTYYLSCQ